MEKNYSTMTVTELECEVDKLRRELAIVNGEIEEKKSKQVVSVLEAFANDIDALQNKYCEYEFGLMVAGNEIGLNDIFRVFDYDTEREVDVP